MIWQMIASLLTFSFYTFIGLGPLLWVGGSNPLNQISAGSKLAIASAFGLTLVAFISHPLYRFVAPVDVFALPVLLMLMGLSGLLIYLYRDRIGPLLTKDSLGLLLVIVLTWTGFASIFLANGNEAHLFGINADDSLVYLTIAESTLSVPWQTLWDGYLPISSRESAAIVAHSPSGMYAARYVVKIPIRMSTIIDIGWYSHVTGIALERSLYSFAMSIYLVVAGFFYGVCSIAKTKPIAAILVALASVFGFWPWMISSHDSYSQLQLLPVLGLMIVFWHFGQMGKWPRFQAYLGIALCYATAVVVYIEFTFALMAIAVALGVATSWLKYSPIEGGRIVLAAVGGGVLFLLFSGQLIHAIDSLLHQFVYVMGRPSTSGGNLLEAYLLKSPHDVIAGTLWLRDLIQEITPYRKFVGSIISIVAAIGVLLATISVILSVVRSREPLPVLMVSAYLGAFSIACFALAYKGDTYAFLKMYAGPFSFSLVVAGAAVHWGRKSLKIIPSSRAAGIFLIVFQLTHGIYALDRDLRHGGSVHITRSKVGAYPIGKIVAALDDEKVKNLIVYVPPKGRKEWWHSAYLMLALREYKPFFQSGYLVDNNQSRLFHSFIEPPKNPEFLLISVSDDYFLEIGKERMIWQIDGLRLYRVSGLQPSLFSYRTKK